MNEKVKSADEILVSTSCSHRFRTEWRKKVKKLVSGPWMSVVVSMHQFAGDKQIIVAQSSFARKISNKFITEVSKQLMSRIWWSWAPCELTVDVDSESILFRYLFSAPRPVINYFEFLRLRINQLVHKHKQRFRFFSCKTNARKVSCCVTESSYVSKCNKFRNTLHVLGTFTVNYVA